MKKIVGTYLSMKVAKIILSLILVAKKYDHSHWIYYVFFLMWNCILCAEHTLDFRGNHWFALMEQPRMILMKNLEWVKIVWFICINIITKLLKPDLRDNVWALFRHSCDFLQQIVRHVERWSVSAFEAILQIFTPSSGSPVDWMFLFLYGPVHSFLIREINEMLEVSFYIWSSGCRVNP